MHKTECAPDWGVATDDNSVVTADHAAFFDYPMCGRRGSVSGENKDGLRSLIAR